jgi:hypothetical protein
VTCDSANSRGWTRAVREFHDTGEEGGAVDENVQFQESGATAVAPATEPEILHGYLMFCQGTIRKRACRGRRDPDRSLRSANKAHPALTGHTLLCAQNGPLAIHVCTKWTFSSHSPNVASRRISYEADLQSLGRQKRESLHVARFTWSPIYECSESSSSHNNCLFSLAPSGVVRSRIRRALEATRSCRNLTSAPGSNRERGLTTGCQGPQRAGTAQ